MASIDFHSYRPSSPSIYDRCTSWLADLGNWLKLWWVSGNEHRRLSSLDDAILKDIGLSRMQVIYKAGRPFSDTAGSKGRDSQS